jgi:hypothetical protein
MRRTREWSTASGTCQTGIAEMACGRVRDGVLRRASAHRPIGPSGPREPASLASTAALSAHAVHVRPSRARRAAWPWAPLHERTPARGGRVAPKGTRGRGGANGSRSSEGCRLGGGRASCVCMRRILLQDAPSRRAQALIQLASAGRTRATWDQSIACSGHSVLGAVAYAIANARESTSRPSRPWIFCNKTTTAGDYIGSWLRKLKPQGRRA